MTSEQTVALLRTRRQLTGEPYSDETVEAWRDALGTYTAAETRAALVASSRQHQRITVAHVVERLPRQPEAAPTAGPRRARCELCGGGGWAETDPARNTVAPCPCPAGRQHDEAYAREQRAQRAAQRRDSTEPPAPLPDWVARRYDR